MAFGLSTFTEEGGSSFVCEKRSPSRVLYTGTAFERATSMAVDTCFFEELSSESSKLVRAAASTTIRTPNGEFSSHDLCVCVCVCV
jgi:hypothetical protein